VLIGYDGKLGNLTVGERSGTCKSFVLYRIHPELIGELVREGTVRWVEVSVGVQYRVIRELVG